MRIVLFGANGPTGRLVTEQALSAGHEVVAVTRRPDAFPPYGEGLSVLGADVLDADAVDAAVAKGDVVLSTVGVGYSRHPITTYSQGTANIIDGMIRHGVRRLAVVSSSAVEPMPHSDGGFVFNRVLQPFMTRVVGKTLYDDMRRMESLVAASPLDWTIVRPAGLYDLPAVTSYELAEAHADGRFTARVDLAASLLKLLADDTYVRKVLAVVTREDQPSVLQLIRNEAFTKQR